MKHLGTLLASALLGSLTAEASVNVHTFSPAANPAYTYSEDALSSAPWSARGQRRVFISAFVDVIDDPIVELNSTRDLRRATLVESFTSLNLSAGYGVLPNLQIGAATSLTRAAMPREVTEFGAGDSRLFAKLRLNDANAPVVFALMPEAHLPTGSSDLFLSNGSAGMGLRLIAERDFGWLQLVGNAGYRYSPDATFRDLDLRSVVPLSLSALVPLDRRWAINADASADLTMPINEVQNPTVLYLGGRYRVSRDILAAAGAAVGAFNSQASAEFRVLAGLTIMPSEPASVVVQQQPQPTRKVSAEAPAIAKLNLLLEDVRFLHNQAVLTSGGRYALDQIASLIESNKRSLSRITIEGHANELGSHEYNMGLSRRRAAAVKRYLLTKGLEGELLPTIAYGKTRPKYARSYPRRVRLAADRRVEFKVAQPSELR